MYCFYINLPALWTVLTAFKDTKEIYEGFSFFPKNLTFKKFIERIVISWGYLDLKTSFINTIVLGLGKVFFRVFACGLGGYALSKIKPKGTKLIFTLVVWTMLMPAQIRMVPNYISWLHFPFAADYGVGVSLLDTFWPMWLGAGADSFAVLLFKNAFDGISTGYVEAAKIDGCNEVTIFLKIMLPLAMPIVIFESINVLVAVWSEFFTPMLVLNEKTVLPLAVYRLSTNPRIEMNTYFMALVFASIPPFLIFIVLHKKILGGVNVGGIKG